MRALVGVGLVALLLSPIAAHADSIMILTLRGAHCTLQRDAKLLGTAALKPGGANQTSITDPVSFETGSHGDILVTCSLGDQAVATTVRYGREVGEWLGAGCVTPSPPDCRNSGPTVDWRYPQLVRIGFGKRNAPVPQIVNYSLGGVMSGPYRITADLELGRLYVASPPAGVLGDGAGVSTASLPVTSTRDLTPEQERAISQDAMALLAKGDARLVFFGKPGRNGQLPALTICTASLDALGRFDIVADGVNHAFDFAQPCLNKQAQALLDDIDRASR